MLFLTSTNLQNHTIVMSRCMHYIFCRGGEVKYSYEGKGKEEKDYWPKDEKWKPKPFPSPLSSSQVGHSCLIVYLSSLTKNIVHAS